MISIERAAKTDSLALERLDRIAWDNPALNKPLNDADFTWRVWITHALVYTAKTDSGVVGAALAFPVIGGKFCLHKLIIHPEWRKRRIATCLLDALLHETDTLGNAVFANIFSDNVKAIQLFEKHGFYRNNDQPDSNRLTNTLLLTRQASKKPYFSKNNYLASIYR